MSELEIHGIVASRSQGLIDAAYRFARDAHGDQKRKYTGEPYINHPVEVARIVASVTEDVDAISAALLHDTIEDTDTTFEQIRDFGFGLRTAILVLEVTDVSTHTDGNRGVRKGMDRDHLAQASALGQTIKLADLIHNTESIIQYDPRFAEIYMREKQELLDVLTLGDATLHGHASQIVKDYYASRGI